VLARAHRHPGRSDGLLQPQLLHETKILLTARMLKALRRQPRSAKYKTVAQLELCDDWLLTALRDWFIEP
jgi:hypothetical protein